MIGLLVIGPDRLPETVRTIALWLGRLKRSFSQVRNDLEREMGTDEVKRQLHNEAIMKGLQETQFDLRETLDEVQETTNQISEELEKPSE